MERKFKDKPPRLDYVFQNYDPPLHFLTLCALHKRPLLADATVHEAFKEYAGRGASEGKAAVGRYVIMPDHMHLFVRLNMNTKLGLWVRGLKRSISNKLPQCGEIWQPGFFDHIVRHSESYSEKWAYVVENPVRAGLADCSSKWPYQGEIVRIDRV
jgi:REP element-mobilizing transposase RayT